MQSVFDWAQGRCLRGYVYALTHELLDDNTLHQERHLMKNAIGKCIEGIRND